MLRAKQVIALVASRQKRNTYGLLAQIQALLAEQDIAVDIVNLHDVDIHDCLGCLHCLEKGGCVWHDGFQPLWERIEAADGLILASPVYVANYGATLKRWVDRAFVYVHRPVLANKPVLAVSTTGGAYLKQVGRLLLEVGSMMGMRKTGVVGRMSTNLQEPVQAQDLRRFVRAVQVGPAGLPPTLGQIGMFAGAKLVSTFSPVDTAFWRERGWDRQLYVFERSLGWKRPLAWLLDRVLMPLARRAFASSAKGNAVVRCNPED